ncbi:hypothetical protein BV509_16985 [Rhodovulum sulfidophilum]|uniref:Uncharacterized protein n=1 Tax=Rhodovulum visakhapatnamense TaxID=364297 RepID=A0ABS1RFQ3_9RHOB|nr:hypothetical protein [Rhodovulum visakhapatnamense]MBL3569419.1 hypothetical protein [Rhodovulum visakhapatnamense]MBL3578360.1 hypothetical protein [Rhodovulum visakhapatnamense]OLS45882.1 hypothetical protein BV509_16985 [Rhodovulum sulfidophilum]
MNILADRRACRIEPPIPIAIVIEQHGAWSVLFAAIAAIFDGRGRPGDARLGRLDNHLRRDIGLPPLPPRRSEPPRWM